MVGQSLHHSLGYVSPQCRRFGHRHRGHGGCGWRILARNLYAGYILQLTHSYASLFALAASAYLVALLVVVLLAPGLKKVEAIA